MSNANKTIPDSAKAFEWLGRLITHKLLIDRDTYSITPFTCMTIRLLSCRIKNDSLLKIRKILSASNDTLIAHIYNWLFKSDSITHDTLVEHLTIKKWFYAYDSVNQFWKYSPDPGKFAEDMSQNRALFDAVFAIRYQSAPVKNKK